MHLTISCDTCVARHTAACEDCVVSFFCGPEERLRLDDAECEAVAGLAAAGLVPELRYRPEPCPETGRPVRRPPSLTVLPGGRHDRHH